MILADDMGMGKSVQITVTLLLTQNCWQVAVITVPALGLQTWEQEIEQVCKNLQPGVEKLTAKVLTSQNTPEKERKRCREG